MSPTARYVVDTHALLWYLGGSDRLGDQALQILNAAVAGLAHIIVPTVALAELAFINERRKLGASVAAVVDTLQQTPGFVIEPLDVETILLLQHTTAVPEMHDRILVCTAHKHQAMLITRDQDITRSGLVKTAW